MLAATLPGWFVAGVAGDLLAHLIAPIGCSYARAVRVPLVVQCYRLFDALDGAEAAEAEHEQRHDRLDGGGDEQRDRS